MIALISTVSTKRACHVVCHKACHASALRSVCLIEPITQDKLASHTPTCFPSPPISLSLQQGRDADELFDYASSGTARDGDSSLSQFPIWYHVRPRTTVVSAKAGNATSDTARALQALTLRSSCPKTDG